jgi:hypothetical protein
MITVKQLKEAIKDMPDDFKVIVYVKYAEPTMLDDKFPVEEGNVYHASPFYFEYPECIARDEVNGKVIPDYMKEECCHIRI